MYFNIYFFIFLSFTRTLLIFPTMMILPDQCCKVFISDNQYF